MKRIGEFLRRREVLGAFLVLFLVSGFYSMKLIGTGEYDVRSRRIGTYVEEGKLKHEAYLRPNELYGYRVGMENYPIPMVERFILTYDYRSRPGLKGTYDLTVRREYYVTRGSEEIVLWEDRLFESSGRLTNGSFRDQYVLDLRVLGERGEEIAEELGVKRLRSRVTVEAVVRGGTAVGGRELSESFHHSVELVKDPTAGLYYFTKTEKVERRPITVTRTEKTTVKVLGVETDVGTARTVTASLTLLSLLPLVGYAYTARKGNDGLKKIRPYIVRGSPENVDRVIYLKTSGDLERAFELIDRPIVHYSDGGDEVFAIIDGNVAYEYRRSSGGKGEKAN